jgi:O-antigen ligase
MKRPYHNVPAHAKRAQRNPSATLATRARFGAGHVAWLAMACSILIWGTSELRTGELGNTGNWYRITLVLFAAAVCAFGLLKNAGRLSQGFTGPLLLLLAYGVIGLISALYIPRYSLYSMWKASELVIDVLAIVVVLSGPQPNGAARIVYKVMIALFGILLVVYSIEALIVPGEAVVPSRGLIPFTLQGVMPVMNGNALAFISAVVAFVAWCRVLKRGTRRLAWLALLVLAVAMLILAQSRTSLIGLVIAVGVQLFFERRFALLALAAVLAAVVAASADIANVTEQYLVRGQSQELFSSLSGRTLAWQAAWNAFQESPVLGHGFAAAARAQILGFTGASTLHGAVFDVLVGVGLLGFIPWATAICWTSFLLVRLGVAVWRRHTNETIDRGAVAEMLGMLALIFVRSTTSSGLALHEHEFMMFLTVLAFCATAKQIQTRAFAVRRNAPALSFTTVGSTAARRAGVQAGRYARRATPSGRPPA